MALLTHPVVWEVFVNDLPHLSLLGVEGAGREVENHVQHAHPHRQRHAPVLWVGIG